MSECYEECPICEGTGHDCPIAETPCVWCEGEGVVPHDCPQNSRDAEVDMSGRPPAGAVVVFTEASDGPGDRFVVESLEAEAAHSDRRFGSRRAADGWVWTFDCRNAESVRGHDSAGMWINVRDTPEFWVVLKEEA